MDNMDAFTGIAAILTFLTVCLLVAVQALAVVKVTRQLHLQDALNQLRHNRTVRRLKGIVDALDVLSSNSVSGAPSSRGISEPVPFTEKDVIGSSDGCDDHRPGNRKSGSPGVRFGDKDCEVVDCGEPKPPRPVVSVEGCPESAV